ncbi:GspE/PulE family protein [Clostridium sp. DL1XJH146]
MSNSKKAYEDNYLAIDFIPKNIATKHIVFPYDYSDEYIYIYKGQNSSKEIENNLRLLTNKRIKATIKNDDFILDKIEQYYGEIAIDEVINTSVGENKYKKEEYLENNLSPATRTINTIIEMAISKKASDIHIEPFKEETKIRFRIDGYLREYRRIPVSIYKGMLTRIKLLSDLDISLKRIPQDGKYTFNINNKKCDLRISTIPTVFGEKIVIRILDKSNNCFALNDLKLNGDERKKIDNILNHSSGLILIAGPTGSGKTTSLYSFINEINRESLNIVSIEDPVEYTIKNVNQINVNLKSGLTFSNGLRSILRQDPDVIIIGEIRDEETAKIAVRASLTGHLVISTIHTKNSIGTIQRLLNMNVKSYLLVDALVGIVTQRLIRTNCSHCSKKSKNDSIIQLHNEKYTFTEVTGEGCEMCEHTGYKGRMALFEILTIDDEIRNQLYRDNFESLAKVIKNSDFIDLKKRCFQMVNEGKTTFEEFKKVYFSV